jgi:hypothetical protein
MDNLEMENLLKRMGWAFIGGDWYDPLLTNRKWTFGEAVKEALGIEIEEKRGNDERK